MTTLSMALLCVAPPWLSPMYLCCCEQVSHTRSTPADGRCRGDVSGLWSSGGLDGTALLNCHEMLLTTPGARRLSVMTCQAMETMGAGAWSSLGILWSACQTRRDSGLRAWSSRPSKTQFNVFKHQQKASNPVEGYLLHPRIYRVQACCELCPYLQAVRSGVSLIILEERSCSFFRAPWLHLSPDTSLHLRARRGSECASKAAS